MSVASTRRCRRAGGGDGEHAAAGAEIEDARRGGVAARRLANPIERQQTAARGAVMAGAEGERRLDLDADAVGGNAGAIVRAVHDEAAGGDRRLRPARLSRTQSFGATRSKRSALAAAWPGRGRNQRPYASPYRAARESEWLRAIALAGIDKADGNLLAGKALRDQIRDPSRRLFDRLLE